VRLTWIYNSTDVTVQDGPRITLQHNAKGHDELRDDDKSIMKIDRHISDIYLATGLVQQRVPVGYNICDTNSEDVQIGQHSREDGQNYYSIRDLHNRLVALR